jgi:HlyD family secretion protein
MKTPFLLSFAFLALLFSCDNNNGLADAYGNFEATEVLISAEATGKILMLDLEEGRRLQAGQLVGIIDTTQLHLKKLQLLAGIQAVSGKTQDAQPQIEILKEQKQNLLREKTRIEALLKDNAATPKQLDDIKGQIDVVDQQIASAQSQTQTFNRGVLGEIDPLRVQIRQVEDQIGKCYVYNPIDGTVLLKFAEPAEVTSMGKPLYKIADLKEMILRVYVSGAQLPHLKIGQKVQVLIDEDKETNRSLEGTVAWISDKAEFTPKIVQTKEERVNLVYAVKIRVQNDGSLKIGMPGEVMFKLGGEEEGGGF